MRAAKVRAAANGSDLDPAIALNAPLETLAAAFQHAMIGMAIAAPDGRLRDANPVFLRMLGFTRDELRSLHITDVTHADDHAADREQWSRLERGEIDTYRRDKRYLRKDGSALWALVMVSALRDEAGLFLGSTAQIQDITAQKAAEAALRENEAKLESLAEQLPIVLYRQPWGGRHAITYASPRFEELTGLSLQKFPSTFTALLEQAHPDDLERIIEVNERTARTGETALVEYRIRGEHGEWVWLDHRSVLVRDDEGQPLAWHGSVIDITERKKLEASLRESEVNAKLAFENAAIGMILADPNDVCLDVNEAYCQIVGIPREELIGRSLSNVTHPGERAAARARLAMLVSGEADTHILEKRYLHPDGRTVIGRLTVSAVRNDDGSLRSYIAQLQDITAQKAAETALRENEELLRSIVESVPAAVYRLEPGEHGRYTFGSPRFQAMTGLTIDRAAQTIEDFFARVHPDDRPYVRAADATAARTGEGFDLEFRMRADDGSWIWIHDRSIPARDQQGNITSWHGVLLNISERKFLEDALRENQARLQSLIEHLPVALYSVEPAPELLYFYTSPQFEQLTGVGAAELSRGTAALDARIHPDDFPIVLANSEHTDATGAPYDAEYRVLGANGEWHWVHDRAVLARDAQGKLLAWHGVILDVSERKRLLEALQENEARLRILVEQLPVALFSLERAPSTRYAYVSPRFGALTGMSPAEIARGTEALFARIHPADVAAVRESDRRMHLSEQPTEIVYRVRNAAGEWVWLQERAMLARDADGRPLAWHGVLLDVSAERRLAGTLRESEARFRSIFEGAAIGMALATVDCRVLLANPALERLLGFGPGELEGVYSEELTHPEDRAEHDRLRQQLAAGEIDHYQIEKRYSRRDGEIVWVNQHVTTVHDERGTIQALIAQIQDVTDRKEAEAALIESEARFRSAFEGAGIGMALAGPDGRFFDANPAFCRFLGYSRDELLSLTYLDITHPDGRALSLEYTRRLFAGEISRYSIEKRYLRADGRTIWGDLTITAVRDAAGIARYEIAQVQDISARKEVEVALLESEARFRSTFEGAGIGMNVADARGAYIDVNPAYCVFLGHSREALLNLTYPDVTHPDDLDLDLAQMKLLKAGEIDSFSLEKRYLHAAGHAVWGHLTVTAIRGPDKTFLYDIAQVQDITARKEAEAARRESETRFQSIFENAAIGMCMTGPDSVIQLANPAMSEFLGHSADEIVGRSIEEFTEANDWLRQNAFRQRARAGEIDAYQMEKRYRRKDGALVWGLLSVSTVRDDAGRLTALIGQVQDITAHKEAETALRESEARFRAVVQHDTDVIVIISPEMEILYVSPSAWEAFGVSPVEQLGPLQEKLDRLHPEDQERTLALFSKVSGAHGAIATTEARIRHEELDWRWFQITIANRIETAGIGGYLFNLRDVTERRQAELATEAALRSQQEAIDELERLNHSKSRFLSTISHEFRTPLTAIIGYSEYMTSNASEPDLVIEDAATIHREASRLNRMIGDLLLIDRVDASRLTLNARPLNLNALIEVVTKSVRPLTANHTLVLDFDPDLQWVQGDYDRLAQALTNLLSNAVKYSLPGATITVTTRTDGDAAVVSIQDEGVGIAPEDLERIFDRFERVESGIAGRVAGTGLGLSIVREIANLHEGDTWAESTLGVGSRFSLSLPASPATAVLADDLDHAGYTPHNTVS